MNASEMLAAAAGGAIGLALVLAVAVRARRAGPDQTSAVTAVPPSVWHRRARAIAAAARAPGTSPRQQRWRVLAWCLAGIAVWAMTGWPVAGIAAAVVMVWLPWLLGSGRIVSERIDRLEALEKWCRRMADTLVGGGAVGLAQAIGVTAEHVDEPIAPAVRMLARDLRDGRRATSDSLRAFADALDDRVGDTVAAALLLALQQQSVGIADVLRQLAEGVARDVRARRDIEAQRAESRQSIRTLLLIQGALLAMLAAVPTFTAPYRTPVGQFVMAVLLGATIALLIWMRHLALGRPTPRFLGQLPDRDAASPR
jgi:tight adherence protein B